MSKTRDATQILDRMTGDEEEMRQLIVEEILNAEVARLIYEARTVTGLTQAELAERIGTKQLVIAHLEDSDYEGHALSMLLCIALALNRASNSISFPLETNSEAV